MPPFQPAAASMMPQQQFAYPGAPQAAAAMPYSSYQDPNWANYYQQQQYYSQAGQPQAAAVTQAQPQPGPAGHAANAAPAINPQTGLWFLFVLFLGGPVNAFLRDLMFF